MAQQSEIRPFPGLTEDVLLQIFSFCNGNDVRRFSEVCSAFRAASQNEHLWKTLFRKRLGHDPEQGADSYRQQYFDQDQTILCVADECEIAHGRLPHWDMIDDPRSIFGKVAMLRAVSWLHVSGVLHGVHTGRYRVIWRLLVMPRAQFVYDINFRARSHLGRTVESHLPPDASLLEFGSDYFDFVLPGILEITEPFEDVAVECKCTSTEWKTNIILCSVRLEIADSQSAVNRYDWTRRLARMDREGSVGLRLRRLRNLRSQPGASYSPWQPWTAPRWYESTAIVIFFVVVAVVFLHLLQSYSS